MQRKKILWLASWYPSKGKPFDGDFIQRHARAAGLYNDVQVIHVTGLDGDQIKGERYQEINNEAGLTEQIIYFRKSTSLFGRVKAQYIWFRLFRNAFKKYSALNGMPDVVHVHVTMKAGLIALWIKKKYNIPFLVTEHWGIYNDILPDNYEKKSSIFKKYTKKILEEAAAFLPVSNYLGRCVQNLVINRDFEIIPNVADTGLFYYEEKPLGKFRFIHVSNMVPLKNAEGILRAVDLLCRDMPDFEMIMVGDTQPEIRQYAEKLGLLDRFVFFRGEIPYPRVAKEMQDANVLVLFSEIETFSCVIAEALCCGLPVIATDVGGIPELVGNSNSILVQPRDDQGLAKAMRQMISNYPEYNRKKIAHDAANKFSYLEVGSKMNLVYESIKHKAKSRKQKARTTFYL